MYPPPRIYFQAEHSRSVFTFVLLRSDKEGWIQNPADGAGMFLWCKWVGRSPPCKWGAPNKWVSTYQSIETLRSQLFQPFEIFSLFALVSGGLWLPVLTMVEEQWEAFAMSRLWIPGVGRRRVCNKLVGGSLEEVATAHSLCNDTLS